MKIEDKLRYFDPSSTDDAMQLAYAALELAEMALTTVEIGDPRQHEQLSRGIGRVSRALHLNFHDKSHALETDPELMKRILETRTDVSGEGKTGDTASNPKQA